MKNAFLLKYGQYQSLHGEKKNEWTILIKVYSYVPHSIECVDRPKLAHSHVPFYKTEGIIF